MPEREVIKELRARPYQEELLAKAIQGNTIVYLGTGSGKTYIAVMLIKHLREELLPESGVGQKAIFLVSSVALVEQQKQEIHNCTGLSVGSYCGADGVDFWGPEKWKKEFAQHQVLVFIHEVFRMVLSRGFIRFSSIAVLIMDECHHAVKKHPYSEIMIKYQEAKGRGESMPRILGLTACVVVRTVTPIQFREEKRKLEAKLDSRVETTADLLDILKYVTDPDEEFSEYGGEVEQPGVEEIVLTIQDAITSLSTIMDQEEKRIMATDQNINFQEIALKDLKEKDFKTLKNSVLMEVQEVTIELGIYSLVEVLPKIKAKVLEECGAQKNVYFSHDVRRQLHDVTLAALCKVESIALRVVSRVVGGQLEKIRALASKKFLKLLDIYEREKIISDRYALSEEGAGQQMMNITFVMRKFTARALAGMLQTVARLDPRFSHLKVDFVHSSTNTVFIKNPSRDQLEAVLASVSESQRLKQVLNKFRKGDLNVLISTSVVEEGLDVRKCNLVIRYDFPQTFRSYVQSKGRARARPSKYIMLIPANQRGLFYAKHHEFQTTEIISKEECYLPRQETEEEMEEDDDDIETFTVDPNDPESGTVTGSRAISLVYQYINKIPRDRFTRLAPAWRVKAVQSTPQEQLLAGLGIGSGSEYRCYCYMPHKTPFLEPVEGPLRPSKAQAKRACALLIVSKLYELGELDERLCVKTRGLVLEEDEDDEEEEDLDRGRKAGTTRRRRFYGRERPSPLNLPILHGSQAHIYSFSIQLVSPVANPRYKLYRPEADPLSLGLLTAEQMPSICDPFHLHSPSGLVRVSLVARGHVAVDAALLEQARNFHNYACDHVLKLTTHLEFSGCSSLLVPLNRGKLDFSLLRPNYRPYTVGEADVVLTPGYKLDSIHYFVEDILSELTPTNRMGKSIETYEEYFHKFHQIRIQNLDQPLLKISSADNKYFMFKPGYEPRADASYTDLSKRSLQVPELMLVDRLPAGLWRQVHMFPFCLERLSSILHCSLLSNRIAGSPLHLSFPREVGSELMMDGSGSREASVTCRELLTFNPPNRTGNIGDIMKAGDLLEALTLKGCNEHFDMEMLEIVGDVFLKYRTSVFAYYKLASGEDKRINVCEGDLTTLRSRVVGNKNLFAVASSLRLGEEAVNSAKLEVNLNWLPPGYTAPLEHKIIALDARLPEMITDEKKRRNLSVGSILSYLSEHDLHCIARGQEEEVLDAAKNRFLEKTPTACVRTREHRVIADKSLADVVEALIGCFLLKTGQQNTLAVMARIGINLTPSASMDDLLARKSADMPVATDFTPEQDCYGNDRLREASRLRGSAYDLLLRKLGVRDIERKIGYTFREKSFLLQAFTHSSFTDNKVTDSYEMLEYLGDAVLDYLISSIIITSRPFHTLAPGKITEIRSALVCNNTFASLLVESGLHGHILYSAPQIQARISDYVSLKTAYTEEYEVRLQEEAESPAAHNLRLINEVEPPELHEVEVPKVLGDVFEALIGAVYIDSGHCLHTVKRVYESFRPQYEAIIQQPPRNPKSQLHELCPSVQFSPAEVREANVRVVATVRLSQDGRPHQFAGWGLNKKMATLAAAKCALRKLGVGRHAASV